MRGASRDPTLKQLLPDAKFDPPKLGDIVLHPKAVTCAIEEVATIKDGLRTNPSAAFLYSENSNEPGVEAVSGSGFATFHDKPVTLGV